MTDTTFLPGPNLRIAPNDSGMSQVTLPDNLWPPGEVAKIDASKIADGKITGLPSGCLLYMGNDGYYWRAPNGDRYSYQTHEKLPAEPVTDKVDPLDPASYTDDVHTNSDGSKVRVQRAKPAPLPENATLQDRLRRYSPVNGYARYCAMAADKIDEQEKELKASRNMNFDLNNQVLALTIAIERLEHDNALIKRAWTALNNLYLQSSQDCQHQAARAIAANAKLHQIRSRGFWSRIYHAFKGEKA